MDNKNEIILYKFVKLSSELLFDYKVHLMKQFLYKDDLYAISCRLILSDILTIFSNEILLCVFIWQEKSNSTYSRTWSALKKIPTFLENRPISSQGTKSKTLLCHFVIFELRSLIHLHRTECYSSIIPLLRPFRQRTMSLFHVPRHVRRRLLISGLPCYSFFGHMVRL